MATSRDRKSEAVNLRMSPKYLLRQVADREHRALSNMLEVLIHERAELPGIDSPPRTGRGT